MTSLDFPFEVIILSDIWSFNIPFYRNLFQDYLFYYALPANSSVGGVGVYVHKSFTVVERNDLIMNCTPPHNVFEYVFLELSKPNCHYLLGSMYRHPSHNISLFTATLDSLLQSVPIRNFSSEFFLIADFNIDLLKFDSNNDISRFLDMLLGYNFLPLFILPTRITDSSSTLIDHIFYRSNPKKTITLSMTLYQVVS